ncbi:MAG: ribH [Xanthomonadaceae bacterium]|nr:ribH [Xanthomonadaceae bacterium]
MPHYEGDLRVTEGARFAIVASRWNPRITDALVAGARKAFIDNGVCEQAVDLIRVPGAWEIPMVAARIAAGKSHVAVVALGCVIRGETRHYEQVADGCADALMRVALEYGLPVCNGVLAVEAHDDARQRAGGSHGNKGEEAALVAIEMAQLLEQLP